MSDFNEISKKLDKIIITYKDSQKIKKVGNWLELLKGKYFFPFKNFTMEIEYKKNLVMKYLIELDTYNPVVGGKITLPDGAYLTYKHEVENSRSEINAFKIDKSLSEYIHVTVISALVYICMQARNRITRVSPNITRQERENYEYQERECYLLNDIVKYVSIHPNKHSLKYRCDVWGVRGHIRHYKNGKMVYIEPYTKGRKRGILEPKSKTYLLRSDEIPFLCDGQED